MANTLTDLLPDAYVAMDVVARELTGFTPAVARDPRASRVALGQDLIIPLSPKNAAGFDIVPAMSIPARADQTFDNVKVTITKSRAYPFSWEGEEMYGMDQGPGALNLRQDQIAQAIRACVNEIESDIAIAAYKSASRYYGTVGTIPFNTTVGDYSDAAQTRKILDDNGAPMSDRHLVINTAAGAAMRGKQVQAQITGETSLLRQGVLYDVNGFAIRESAQIATHTAGAMAGATTSNAALTVGQTVLPLATAGTGQVAAGDVITLANDTNKYTVVSVSFAGANPASGDSITIAAPGLQKAQAAATRAITVIASGPRNVAFVRNAIVLATRLPKVPPQGDLAKERIGINDPLTGISLDIAYYPGYHMGTYHVECAWGVKVIKPEFVAGLLG